MTTIHLIANAHLDPVWLWDAREGLNEGIATCGTILDLMDEFPDLTFMRGEAAIYDHIEKFAPETFARIQRHVASGRWEIVGGTWIQPDTNLTSARTLARQFETGQAYFQSRFGKTPMVAWAADSFGHSAGLPSIFAAAGMDSFAFTRPFPAQMELPSPVFWWEGPDGARVLSYRPPRDWYGCERGEMERRLESCLLSAQEHQLEHVACFYGLGNHGGGPTRKILRDLETWRAAHPEVRVVHSGLHHFFAAQRAQVREWPTVRGELGFCLRGCYSSALRIKTAFRAAEVALERAEIVSKAAEIEKPKLESAAESVLFNSFHDILPGTSIERALDEQLQELGGALHQCRRAELRAMNALAARLDTSVPAAAGDFPTAVPFVVFNPHDEPYSGFVELENCVDARPIHAYHGKTDELPLEVRGPDGAVLPFQRLLPESDFFLVAPWRVRALVPVELPTRGSSVYTLGYVEGAHPAEPFPASATSPRAGTIENRFFRVETELAARGIRVWHNGQPLLGGDGLTLETRSDPWGSWGGLSEEPDSLTPGEICEAWRITQVETLENGPLRAVLWVRLAGEKSWLDLTFSLLAGHNALDVTARLRWNERSVRLKMVLPLPEPVAALRGEFEVPAAVVERGECGEVPGSRWVRVGEAKNGFGFASDALYGFELRENALRPTIARATRYASDGLDRGELWRPTLDAGEHKFRFLLCSHAAPLEKLARELEMPPLVQSVASRRF